MFSSRYQVIPFSFLRRRKNRSGTPMAGIFACKAGSGVLLGVPVLIIVQAVGRAKIGEVDRKHTGRLV